MKAVPLRLWNCDKLEDVRSEVEHVAGEEVCKQWDTLEKKVSAHSG